MTASLSPSPAEVYYVLDILKERGFLVDSVVNNTAKNVKAFWHGIADGGTGSPFNAKTVRLHNCGSFEAVQFEAALNDLDVRVSSSLEADLNIILTDDYLESRVEELANGFFENHKSFMLIKPSGLELWIGPICIPEKTGCYECLAMRLRRNQPVRSFLKQKIGLSPLSTAWIDSSLNLGFRMAALDIMKFLNRAGESLVGKVISIDIRNWAINTHLLSRSPHCRACGRIEVPEPVPIELVTRKVTYSSDGGHRTVMPEETIKKFHHLISPITGIVNKLVPVNREDGMAHVFMAGQNPAVRFERLSDLMYGLRNQCSGKGMSESQAKASALCEALERYSSEFTGTEYRLGAAFSDIRDQAIHPNTVMLFSDTQLRAREQNTCRKSKFNWVPDSFNEEEIIDWSPIWSLTENRHKYLPTQFLYFGAATGGNSSRHFSIACSNGCASGNNIEEAILQGFLELVERDATALWWYNRLKKPSVQVETFDQPYLLELIKYYESCGRKAWALDLTSDFGIPVFAAISFDTQSIEERILFGLGCHLEPTIALQRAFVEMNQMLAMVEEVDRNEDLILKDIETLNWLSTATIEEHSYLLPDDKSVPSTNSAFPSLHSNDLLEDINFCKNLVEARGMEMLVLDQTRSDVGISAVKVIVPGLRHFRARFAPGRLFEVPVQMGWLLQARTEAQLNPIAIFI